jgi:hypothetical protein
MKQIESSASCIDLYFCPEKKTKKSEAIANQTRMYSAISIAKW